MAKLVEILAEKLTKWPEGATYALQNNDTKSCEYKKVYFYGGVNDAHDFYCDILRVDCGEVTRAQWEAERARIATNQQATQEAREIAGTGTMTNEEQELASIACGKRTKEDQSLWDKVAKDLYCQWVSIASSKESWGIDAEHACNAADAFMAERAKRLKGGV